MRFLTSGSLAGALAVLPVAYAFSYPPQTTPDKRQIKGRDVPVGGQCGPDNGNAVCATDLCCSEHGFCGTGADFCIAPNCLLDFGPACDGNRWPQGTDTSRVPRPRFGKVPYGADVSKCKLPGKVALTFDDGPNKYTNDLLDVLKKNNAKATFFVVGANGAKGEIEDPRTGYLATIQRMYHEGHQVGSHSWSHQNFTAINPQQRHDQIIKNEVALVDILGFFPTYLRPPYTTWNDEIINEFYTLGYHNLNFDLNTRDWEGDYNVAQNEFSSALSGHNPASSSFIAVAHDIEDKTVHGYVQFMIDEARKYKYELVTVGECLGDHPNNWYRDANTGGPFGGEPKEQPEDTASASAGSPPSPSAQSTVTEPASAVATSTASPNTTYSVGKEDGPRSSSGSASTSLTAATPSIATSTAAAPKPNVAKRQELNLTMRLVLGSLVLFAWLESV